MRRHRSPARLVSLALLMVSIALMAGCGADITATFDLEGGVYDDAALESLLAGHDLGDAAEVATVDAVEIREDVLIDLRTQGDEAGPIADILTRDFPIETPAIPVLVEAAEYGGLDAWVVLEAWGDDDGDLVHARVWVFERETGALLYSASRR